MLVTHTSLRGKAIRLCFMCLTSFFSILVFDRMMVHTLGLGINYCLLDKLCNVCYLNLRAC